MKIKVLLFSQAKNLAGFSERTLDLPEGSHAGDIFKDSALSSLTEHRASMRLAVNEEFAPERTDIKDGDVVAVIPPVSGG